MNLYGIQVTINNDRSCGDYFADKYTNGVLFKDIAQAKKALQEHLKFLIDEIKDNYADSYGVSENDLEIAVSSDEQSVVIECDKGNLSINTTAEIVEFRVA